MNNSITKHNPSNSIFERQTSGLASETRQLISLGHRHNWPFQVLGKAPMLQEPVRLGDWLLVPAQDDSTKVPERAMAKIQAIFAAGIRPQGFVVVHEAPKILRAPVAPKIQPKTTPITISSPQSNSDFASLLGTGFTVLASLFLPMMYLFITAAMIDPILVAVTEDDYWIEIDRWYTE